MDVDPELSTTALRVSFGWSSEASDVKRFLDAWGELARRAAGGAIGKSSAA